MLDPRIYRTGMIIAALALVVLAFSLKDQQTALNPTLAPSAFNGQNVATTIAKLAYADPSRRPGSNGDQSLAVTVRNTLDRYGFAPTTDTFTGRTVDGTVPLENVVGIRPGTQNGSIVIVAPRDALGSPAAAALSSTATLMELARNLEGETLRRSIVLASTSGTQGTAGAIRLAATLGGPVDAVLVLGDVASAHVQQPIILPWSTRQAVAPPALRNTVASALGAQTSLANSFTGLGGQFAHLAFPFTLGQQAPFGARGIPAVELSLSWPRSPRWTAARRCRRPRPTSCSAARWCPGGRSRCSSCRCWSPCSSPRLTASPARAGAGTSSGARSPSSWPRPCRSCCSSGSCCSPAWSG
jgi:hypothetical protein